MYGMLRQPPSLRDHLDLMPRQYGSSRVNSYRKSEESDLLQRCGRRAGSADFGSVQLARMQGFLLAGGHQDRGIGGAGR